MAAIDSRAGSQRVIALVLLLVSGIVSLPVAAIFLDGETTENLIIPVQLALMAVVGAAVGYLLPGVTGADSSRPRTAGFGALIGVATALIGVALFYVLL